MPKEAAFWDKAAQSYDNRVNKTYAKTYEDTIARAKKYLSPGNTLLDYACGTGITTVQLAGSVKRITAVDISEGMIGEAKKKTADLGIANVDFSVGNIFGSEFEGGSFDVVTAFNVLYFIRDPDALLARFRELLVPSGIFLSATDCIGESPSFQIKAASFLSTLGIFPYIRSFTREKLFSLMTRNGFEILEEKNLFDKTPNRFIAARKTS